MTRYYFYHTAKYQGSWYKAGSVYQLDSAASDALIGFCVREGEPVPQLNEPTPAEQRIASRARCAAVEAERIENEREAREARSLARQALRRIDSLAAEVEKAVDEFETQSTATEVTNA